MLVGIELMNPEFLWLYLLLPFLIVWYYFKNRKQQAQLKMPSLEGFSKNSLLTKIQPIPSVLRMIALSLVILALARPRKVDVTTHTKKNEGIDIVMAMDVSSSMLAQDLKPNRLDALKKVADDFVLERKNDRIGLVVYAGESYTKTPITTDKSIVRKTLSEVRYDGIIKDGTAIGMGLATSVNRLKDSKAKSKVIILLTDGVNNSGFIDPKIATELAIEFQIKVYTIGLGSNGNAMSPVAVLPNGKFQYGLVKVKIDEELLKTIAKKTGGRYFRATDTRKLKEIYDEINKLEKTEIEELKYYNYEEKFRPLLLLAIGFFILEWILKYIFLRSFI